ncbi:MAG: type II toxin-antitoxin system HicA family toxin [Oscillospiraceae bacterium]|nr:type II toxin-antitoxin system HicA family toxin [Oscillospiraceae bacterium]
MKQRDLIKKLEAGGYRLDRKGDHLIYEKKGSRPVQVPDHREIKEVLAKKILRDAGLK